MGLNEIIDKFEIAMLLAPDYDEDADREKTEEFIARFCPKKETSEDIKRASVYIAKIIELDKANQDIDYAKGCSLMVRKRRHLPFSEVIAGIYLTQLIENSEDNYFSIYSSDTCNLMCQFDEDKEVHVFGSVCDSFCENLKKGTIYLQGLISGNFGCYGISGGKVTIKGEVDSDFFCYSLSGGEIVLDGNFKQSQSNTWEKEFENGTGGNVYHNGKLIVKEGKLIGPEITSPSQILPL